MAKKKPKIDAYVQSGEFAFNLARCEIQLGCAKELGITQDALKQLESAIAIKRVQLTKDPIAQSLMPDMLELAARQTERLIFLIRETDLGGMILGLDHLSKEMRPINVVGVRKKRFTPRFSTRASKEEWKSFVRALRKGETSQALRHLHHMMIGAVNQVAIMDASPEG